VSGTSLFKQRNLGAAVKKMRTAVEAAMPGKDLSTGNGDNFRLV
jgi:hypothetical protein